ncbi:MAG: hypothetical protein LBS53_13250 [Synergistaceae bacterium]|jgi:chromosome segregation ATPase|nr:hypothetical protein [Synergistaceae bacterium]
MPTTLEKAPQKESVSVLITPVDERRFDSENKKLTSEIENVKKSQEKFETRIEKKFDEQRQDMNIRLEKVDARFARLTHDMNAGFEKVDVRFERLIHDMNARFEKVDARFERLIQDMNTRFEKVDARFDKIDARFEGINNRLWWVFSTVILSILAPVVLKFF